MVPAFVACVAAAGGGPTGREAVLMSISSGVCAIAAELSLALTSWGAGVESGVVSCVYYEYIGP